MAVQISGNDITVPRDGSFTRNVTIGGTLTYEDVTNIDSVGLVTARTGIEIGARPGVAASISVDGNMIISGISTFGDDITFTGTTSGRDVVFDTSLNQIRAQDNAKLCAGSSSDLEIYHTGSASYIDNYTGALYLRNNVSSDVNGDIYIQAKSGENSVACYDDGAVELYYDNTKKIETTSGGAQILNGTGNAQLNIRGGSSDGTSALQFITDDANANNDSFRLYADGNNELFIQNYSTGSWVTNMKVTGGDACKLHFSGSKKFETTNTGVTVTGAVTATTFESSTFSKTPTNTPAFHAYYSGNTSPSLSNNTWTKVTFLTTETLDTDSAYDGSKFTVPSGKGGYYQVATSMNFYADNNDMKNARVAIYKNGSVAIQSYNHINNYAAGLRHLSVSQSGVLNLSASDYLEVYVNITTNGASAGYLSNDANGVRGNFFSAFKLII